MRGVAQAGRRPVFLAGAPSPLRPYGGRIRLLMRLRTTMDENALTVPPPHNRALDINLWMSEPAP